MHHKKLARHKVMQIQNEMFNIFIRDLLSCFTHNNLLEWFLYTTEHWYKVEPLSNCKSTLAKVL